MIYLHGGYHKHQRKLNAYGLKNPIREMVKMSEEFKKAESGDVFKFENEGDSIEGKFIGLEESKQYEGSYAISLDVEGSIKVTFVNNIVKDLIEKNKIKHEQIIKIVYTGMKKGKSGNEYKTFEVFYK